MAETQRAQEKTTLGKHLAALRTAAGLSLRQVEDATNKEVSNAYLSQLETAKVQSPSPVVLHKLSELYDLPYATVMELAGYPVPQNVKTGTGSKRLAARIGQTTPEEEDSIVEYLRFIRSQRNRKDRA